MKVADRCVMGSGSSKSESQAGDATTIEGVNECVLNFATRMGQASMYAILVVDSVTMQHLGKELPAGEYDSGVIGGGVEVANFCTPRRQGSAAGIKQEMANSRKRRQRERESEGKRARLEPRAVIDTEESVMATAMNNKTRMEGLKALLSVLPAGSAEYKKLVKAMMAASGVSLGDNDYEDNEAEGTVE
jgi:hypothetical protein